MRLFQIFHSDIRNRKPVSRRPLRFINEENVLAIGDQPSTKIGPYSARTAFDVYSLLQPSPLLRSRNDRPCECLSHLESPSFGGRRTFQAIMQERYRQSSIQPPNSSKTTRPANEKRRKRVPLENLTFAYFESMLVRSCSVTPSSRAAALCGGADTNPICRIGELRCLGLDGERLPFQRLRKLDLASPREHKSKPG